MARWTPKTLLRALARRARRWADAVLADEAAPAGPRSPPGATEAPYGGDPLARWMEKVRRAAPGLWREIQAGRAPGLPPPRPARPGARIEQGAEACEASTPARRGPPRAGPDAGARGAARAPPRPLEGAAAPTARDETPASRSPAPARVEAGRKGAPSGAPPAHNAPPRPEQEPPRASWAPSANARETPSDTDRDRAGAPARHPGFESSGRLAAPEGARAASSEGPTLEPPGATVSRRGADDLFLPWTEAEALARPSTLREPPAPPRSPGCWPFEGSDPGAAGWPNAEEPARAGVEPVWRAISAEARAPIQPAQREVLEDLRPAAFPAPSALVPAPSARAPVDALASRWPELPEPAFGDAEPDVERLVRVAERRSRLDREHRGS